jgi:hypothetical protein
MQRVSLANLPVSQQLAFSSNLIGLETTANAFNKQKLVSHLERQEAAKHDPEF